MQRIMLINNETKRFYNISIYKDLFETWNLQRIFGGLTNNLVHVKNTIHETNENADTAMKKIIKQRIKNGYQFLERSL